MKPAQQINLLVRRENNVVLPFADELVEKSQKLPRLLRKRRRTIKSVNETRKVALAHQIGIDHGGVHRGREFLPVEDERNPTATNPLGREYAEFVTREVMPFIASNYPVAAGALNTGFGGSSYGAIAALNTAMIKPGVFGKLLVESPSLYVGGEYLLRRTSHVDRWPGRICQRFAEGAHALAQRELQTRRVARHDRLRVAGARAHLASRTLQAVKA